MANDNAMAPIHPGEILAEDFLAPMGVTQNRLANAIGVPPRRINEIVHGKRSVTADTALRLSRFFGTTDLFWLNLQDKFELDLRGAEIADQLDEIKPFAGIS